MNLKKYCIFISLFFLSLGLNAQIEKNEILNASKNFISENSIFEGYSAKSNVIGLYSEEYVVAYLVPLTPEGYIIFTASKNLYPVFSYSEKGKFNVQEAKTSLLFQTFLSNLKNQEEIAKSKDGEYKNVINKNRNEWNKLLSINKRTNTFDYQYGAYLIDIWGGVNCWDNEGNPIYPSNYFTPNHFSPGCVAISASQILNYYKWPPVGVGSHTDNDNYGSSQGSYYARFGSMFYDWKNMLNDYQGRFSTDTEQRAIGRLMYHVAVSVDMDFENEGSTSHANKVPNAFQSYFRATGHYQTRTWYEFRNRLKTNLENKMPVEFGIKADNGDEHACVCDGYRYNEGDAENDKFYHLVLGWWNWYGGNAWYKIFDEFNAVGYSIITGGVFDILPKPMMNKVVRTSDDKQFIVNWKVSKKLNWEAFELQESYNNGTWVTINNNITDTFYLKTVSTNGIYKYRVQAKVGGSFYSDNFSNIGVVQVGETIFLNFDGNDSFFVNDSYDKLDVSDNWTIESWVKVDSYNANDWSVIMDRRNVFSLYLNNDADADFSLTFATRDASDNILASLNSANSSVNLEFNKWFHVAVSCDGTNTRFFINGQLIEESNNSDFILTSSTNALNIGGRWWGSYSRYINGQIDEIKISDIAQYSEEFCPDRFELAENDLNTRLLLNLQYGTGTSLFEASRNFLYINLRNSPNTPNWQTETTPVINIQPTSKAVCSGNIDFEINATNTDFYQWQINNSSGFVNFTDNANISGSNSNLLTINNVSSFSEDNTIRCILSNNTVPHTCSQDAVFSVYGNCTIWNGTSWTNGFPNASKSAIIDANYTANSFLTTDNLTINANDTLYINENYTLNVVGDIINNGTLILKSENTNEIPGTFIHSGTLINYGNFIAQKKFETPNSEINENIYLFSNPVSSSKQIGNIFNNSSEIFENSGNISTWKILSSENDIEKDKAYMLQTNEDDLVSFKGIFNTGTKNNTLKQLGNDDFFFFLSNPYPSYINWNAALGWDKQNINPNIYTYNLFNNGNSYNYSVWDGTIGLHSANGYITPMEAYFVFMSDYRASIQSDNSVRVSTEDVNISTTIPENLIRFKFETEDENIYDESVIYFGDTENLCLKPMPLSDSKFYTFLPSSGKKYAIKRFVNPNLDTLVAVGFKTSQGGQIKFKVTEFTFDDSTPVQLKDLWTGQYKTLKLDSTYTFTASTSEPDNRFKLYFGDYVVSVNDLENDNTVKAWSSENSIFIRNNLNKNISYKLFDIAGKIISEGKTESQLTVFQSRNKGINILKLYFKNKTKVYKLNIF